MFERLQMSGDEVFIANFGDGSKPIPRDDKFDRLRVNLYRTLGGPRPGRTFEFNDQETGKKGYVVNFGTVDEAIILDVTDDPTIPGRQTIQFSDATIANALRKKGRSITTNAVGKAGMDVALVNVVTGEVVA